MYLDFVANHQIFHFIVCTAYHADWPHNPDSGRWRSVSTELVEWPEAGIGIVMCARDFSESDAYLAEFYARTQALNPALTNVCFYIILHHSFIVSSR